MSEHDDLKTSIEDIMNMAILIQFSAMLTDINNQLKQPMTRNKRRQGIRIRNERIKDLQEMAKEKN